MLYYMQFDKSSVTVAKRLVLLPRLINAESQSSDCYPILLNMQRHSRFATVMPRRCGVAASFLYFATEKALNLNIFTKNTNRYITVDQRYSFVFIIY